MPKMRNAYGRDAGRGARAPTMGAAAEFPPRLQNPAAGDHGLRAGWSLLSILTGFYATAKIGNLVDKSRSLPSGYILVTETPGQ